MASRTFPERRPLRAGMGFSHGGRLLRRAGQVPVLGTLARTLVRRFGEDRVVRIQTGPLRGMKWQRGPGLANGYWLGTYEIEVQACLARLVRPGQVVYDIGAHVGFFSLLAASRVGREGRVYAFEPVDENREILERQLRLNGYDNIEVEACAVSGREEVGEFRRMESASQGRLIRDFSKDEPTIQVPVITLNAFSRNHPAPSLIKIDVEGFEDDVLAGAVDLLEREDAPKLIIELHEADAARRVIERLGRFQYTLFDLQFRSFDPSSSPSHLVAVPNGRMVSNRPVRIERPNRERESVGVRSRRLAVFVSHPVQYHVPVWRELSGHPGVDLHVYYMSSTGLDGSIDPDFGLPLRWALPLREGYAHSFVDGASPDGESGSLTAALRAEADRADAVLIAGYTRPFERRVVRWARRQGIPVIMRGEFSDLNPERPPGRSWAREQYLRWFYRQVSAFGAIGKEAKAHLLRRGVRPEQLHASPYCVDAGLFEEAEEGSDEALRKELGLEEGRVTLLFVGKLIDRKRPMLLLEALERCRHREQIQLVAVGDGPLRECFLNRGREVLGERLKFAGFVDPSRIVPYFGVSELLVLPSRYEAWGLVVNEAMHCGIPALVSDRVSCHHDLIHQGKTGALFPSEDVDALAAAIDRLTSDRSALRQMGHQARRHIAGYGPRQAADGLIRALELVAPGGWRTAPGEDAA